MWSQALIATVSGYPGISRGESVTLAWTTSGIDDEDLFGYRIYRGDEAGFALIDDNLVGISTGLNYLDESGLGTWRAGPESAARCLFRSIPRR